MLKKLLCLVITAAIAAGAAACGAGSENPSGSGSVESATNATESETTISIAALSSETYLESAVEEYEKAHPGITIDLKTYAATPGNVTKSESAGGQASGGGKKMQQVIMGKANPQDLEKYVNTLNTEIMSGKAPDIISVDQLPYRKYADKNLLANLSEMMQADKSFDVSRYSEGILDAVKYKESLYAFPVKYTLDMLNGDKTLLDAPGVGVDDSKWSWQDFKAIAEKLLVDGSQQGKSALANISATEFLNYVMGSSYDKFIDLEKKNADFANAEFKDMLNFCKELFDKKLVDTTTVKKMTGRGNTLFDVAQISMPMDYMRSPQMEFNGNGKLYRLPGSSEPGSVSFSSDAMFSINNSSKHKNEAWEFIKYLLSDEVQSRMELAGFPVNKAALDTIASQAANPPKGAIMKVVTPEGEMQLKPPTEEDISAMKKVLEGVNRYNGADREVLKIILEEAEPFFKGQKTVDEAVELIQNRVNTYVKE